VGAFIALFAMSGIASQFHRVGRATRANLYTSTISPVPHFPQLVILSKAKNLLFKDLHPGEPC